MTILVTLACYLRTFSSSNGSLTYFLNFILLTFFSLGVFVSSSLLGFYVIFELRLIPIVFIILGWGYQPERLKARMALLLYTITASLPLLLSILTLNNWGSTTFLSLSQNVGELSYFSTNLISAMLRFAFLVKLPMFLVHMWLPKAHVEAPVGGSIFLAAVLLKLGGLGVIRVIRTLSPSIFVMVAFAISATSLIWIGFVATSHRDIKSIIAYSSVAHMGLSLIAILVGNFRRVLRGFMVLLTHGGSSSFMFIESFFIYTRSKSRSILLSKNSLSWSGFFALAWFIACLGIIGAPPTRNIWAEVLCIVALIRYSFFTLVFLIIGALLAGAYSLALFSFVYHCKSSNKPWIAPTTFLERRVGCFHVFWLVAPFLLVPWLIC